MHSKKICQIEFKEKSNLNYFIISDEFKRIWNGMQKLELEYLISLHEFPFFRRTSQEITLNFQLLYLI